METVEAILMEQMPQPSWPHMVAPVKPRDFHLTKVIISPERLLTYLFLLQENQVFKSSF